MSDKKEKREEAKEKGPRRKKHEIIYYFDQINRRK